MNNFSKETNKVNLAYLRSEEHKIKGHLQKIFNDSQLIFVNNSKELKTELSKNNKSKVICTSNNLIGELLINFKNLKMIESINIFCYKFMTPNKFLEFKKYLININNEHKLNFIRLSFYNRFSFRSNEEIFEGLTGGYYFDSNESCINFINIDIIYFMMKNKQFSKEESEADFINFFKKNLTNEIEKAHFEDMITDIKNKNFSKNIILWYTCSLFHRMINNIFRKDDVIALFQIRYAVYLFNERLKSMKIPSNPNLLYRGTVVSEEEFRRIEKNVGKSFFLRGFISTSYKLDIVKNCFSKNSQKNQKYFNILIRIQVNDTELSKIRNIEEESFLPQEKEYLLDYSTFLKIIRIFESEDKDHFDYEIDCCTSNFDEVKGEFKNGMLEYKNMFTKEILSKNFEIEKLYLVELLLKIRKDNEALELLESIKKNDGANPIVLNYIGMVYMNKGNYDLSIKYFMQVLDINLNISGKNQNDLAANFNNLASAYLFKGNYDETIKLSLKCQDILIYSSTENYIDLSYCYNYLGSAYLNKGEFEKSYEFYNKALTIQLNSIGNNHPFVAVTYSNLGIFYLKVGKHKKSLICHNDALKIRLNSLVENHPDIASTYNNIGCIYEEEGNYDKSIENYEKCLNIEKKSLGENHPNLATTYCNIGNAYLHKEDCKKSIINYKKCLEIEKKLLEEDHPQFAITYYNLASAHLTDCDYEQSIFYFTKCLNIQLKRSEQNHPDLANTYNNLGVAYRLNKQNEKSIEFLNKSYYILLDCLGKDNPEVQLLYNNILAVNQEN